MTSLCSIFTDATGFRVKLGRLVWDENGPRAPLFMADPCSLIPVCRTLKEQEVEVLYAAGQPYARVENPPFITASDLQFTSGKKRTQIGHIYTDTRDGDGAIIYQVRILTAEVLKKYDYIGIHVHEPTEEEIKERMSAETVCAQTKETTHNE